MRTLAVIFDMDGLMLDTERVALTAWMTASRACGHPLTEVTCKGMIGLGQSESGQYLRTHFQDDHRAELVEAAAWKHYTTALESGVPCKAGLLELLQSLNGVPKAVATSTRTALATHQLQRCGVLGHFDVLIGGDQVANGKPAPDIFLRAADALDQHPDRCVVLEDSGPGIRAAKAAGMRVIYVPDICEVDAATRSLAVAMATSLFEVMAIIHSL